MKRDESKIVVGIFDKLAKLYQEKFMDVSIYHSTFDFFCAAIPKESPEILELACGPGNITKYLIQKRPDFKFLSTDLDPCMIALAKVNNPSVSFQVLDIRKINQLPNKYDAIVCGFCFPFLAINEIEKLIADATQILNPNGVIYLSTIEADYNHSGLKKGSTGDEMFLHYYLEKDITSILKKNDFEILDLKRINSPSQETKDLIIIAKHRE